MSRRVVGSGRRDGTERIRELVALIGSLCEVGDSVSVEAIATRLGLSDDEARHMMDIVCMAAGEQTGGLLISSDDDAHYVLQYPGIHGRPVRLTPSETSALVHALDDAGVDDEDPLRQQVEGLFSFPGTQEEAIRRSLGTRSTTRELILCARSQVTRQELTFIYRGIKDESPRSRRVLVRELVPADNTWQIRATDLDLTQPRTFRLDRMDGLALGEVVDSPVEDVLQEEQPTVELVFTSDTYFNLFEWPGLVVLHVQTGIIHATIPVYSASSPWLIRRIAACRGTVFAKDKRIMNAVREYATQLLNNA